jgi:signal transduction histidine kinase
MEKHLLFKKFADAKLLGGEVTVRSVPGKGTRIVVDFPVDHKLATAAADDNGIE